jgi:hypothetical protein
MRAPFQRRVNVTKTRILAAILLSSFFYSTRSARAVCYGDCGADGEVTVDELIVGVNIALGVASVSQCTPMDSSGDGEVTVDELIGAVNNALTGCPMGGLAGTYSATVSFDATHNGIINVEADAAGTVTGSLVVVSPHRDSRFAPQLSFSFPVNGVSVQLAGVYDIAAGGFEVEGSFVDANGHTVSVVISGTLPGLTGQEPVNVYVGSDTFSATLGSGTTPVPSATPGPTPTPGAGHKIVYSAPVTLGTFNDIWVVNPDGSGKTNLTKSPSNFDTDPAWSRDGSRIAWSRLSMGSYQLAVMNADGGDQHVITDEEGSDNDVQPAWSPDGQQIVFIDKGGSIVIVQADGSARHTVLSGTLDISQSQPNWSPDGSKIVFGSNRDNLALHFAEGFELYTIHPDGSGLTRLTTNAASDDYPVWTPDGGSIFFVGLRTFRKNVLRISANGSGEQAVTSSFLGADAAAMSRDGTQIVYTGFGASPLNAGLIAANANGSGEHVVVPNGEAPSSPDIY